MTAVQAAASGIPPGCCVCRAGEPVVFAALDHRLMAAKPPACSALLLAANAIASRVKYKHGFFAYARSKNAG